MFREKIILIQMICIFQVFSYIFDLIEIFQCVIIGSNQISSVNLYAHNNDWDSLDRYLSLFIFLMWRMRHNPNADTAGLDFEQ